MSSHSDQRQSQICEIWDYLSPLFLAELRNLVLPLDGGYSPISLFLPLPTQTLLSPIHFDFNGK